MLLLYSNKSYLLFMQVLLEDIQGMRLHTIKLRDSAWPNLKQSVKEYVAQCVICQQAKTESGLSRTIVSSANT